MARKKSPLRGPGHARNVLHAYPEPIAALATAGSLAFQARTSNHPPTYCAMYASEHSKAHQVMSHARPVTGNSTQYMFGLMFAGGAGREG